MEFINSISLGELIVGVGTILLAVITGSITIVSILEAKRIRKEDIERAYKLRLLDNIQNWLTQINDTIDEKIFDTKTWKYAEEYYRVDNLIKKLLHLSSLEIYDRIQAEKMFQKYQFKQKAEKYRDSFGKFTDKLHDGVEPGLKKSFEKDYADYETDFINETVEFGKFISQIRVDEKL